MEETTRGEGARGAGGRWTLPVLLALGALCGVTFFAYRIALARVPQYRAALERVVRTRTGLDVRFNELGLSWGWYGPEAVFRAVELGEPGGRALLTASKLIVDFDVWHAMHTGELEAQRVTLIAPDIDLARLNSPATTQPMRGAGRSSPVASAATELLERWPGGRVDIEDAILTVPDPAHAAGTDRVDVRRAILLRSGQTWRLYAQAFLPEHLGRAATLALQFTSRPRQLLSDGRLSFEGRGLRFGGWSDLVRARWPGAPYLPSAGIGNLRVSASLVRGQLHAASVEIHADELAVRPGDLAVGRLQGTFDLREISPIRWQLATRGATIGPLQVASLEASWGRSGEPRARMEGAAGARIEELLPWLSRSPATGLALALRNLQGRGAVRLHLESTAAGAVQLSAGIDAGQVQVAPQLPPFEEVRGTIWVSSGHLLRSTLHATWLGGSTTLHLAEHGRGGAGLSVQADGALDARELVAASGIDTGGARVAGRTDWRGELVWDPAEHAWHARADASFVGISSQLPDPLAKPERQPAPFHVDVTASGGVGRARVAGENVRGAFELAAQDDGVWLVRGGVLQFGASPTSGLLEASRADAAKGLLELRGTLDSVDLPAWLIAWRRLAAVPEALPVEADLKVGELTLAGRRYPDVSLTARTQPGIASGLEGATLRVDSAGLSGTIDWPDEAAAQLPVKVHLERVDLQDSPAPLALAPLLGSLGISSEVQADEILWHGRSLGALDAHVAQRAGTLLVDPVRLAAQTQDLQATIRCRTSQACRAHFVMASRDAAQTLRDFGFRADMASADALLRGDVEWPREVAPLDPAWLASVSGHVSVELTNGTLRAPAGDEGVPFALLPVAALLADSSTPLTEPALAFSRLAADYALHDGTATTSDLQFDGDAEILLDGRIGLTTRDYDCRAWILPGNEQLPETLRSFLATPRVAAAWMALRDLITGADHTSPQLHLGGTWDAPEVRIEGSDK